MKTLQNFLLEIYFLINRPNHNPETARYHLFFIGGFFMFLISALKHLKRKNYRMFRSHLKLAPGQLIYAARQFPDFNQKIKFLRRKR